jgi:hypothetical protein
MSHECKKINNHSGITIVDDYILEKPYIKQNYMGSGVPFQPIIVYGYCAKILKNKFNYFV